MIFSLIWPRRGGGGRVGAGTLLLTAEVARTAAAGMAGAGTWQVLVAIPEGPEERRGFCFLCG
jgi:hypothetical protein